METSIHLEFTISEINLILDALLDKPARQSIMLIKKIEAEAPPKIIAAQEKAKNPESE